jgi:membrane protease YdiL (CAAX protease family)
LTAELAIVGAVLFLAPFSAVGVVFLLVLASQSLWLREIGWRGAGLRRPDSIPRALFLATGGAVIVLVATRLAIIPLVERLTGSHPDLSALVLNDPSQLARWMLQAWTLAAFGEEMVFRGYLLHRLTDALGDTRTGWGLAIILGGVAFGFAHAYQGVAGMITTGAIGCLLGVLYLRSGRNLWVVILCHALIDTAGLLAIYFDQRWLLP